MARKKRNTKKTEKKIVSTKTYTIKAVYYDDNSWACSRTNDGFNFYELIGILSHSCFDMIDKMSKGITPDIIKRTVIIPK